ncbi:NAD-dependent epimerase/dehydratase family protein [Streptomyces sp. HNM0575]|uniref:NAD-dependent epimerase/dehydratase family protein n=1 Tax=Streptomyces sp. HNM0575 TaxID=2716338 RepID=UPI00145F910E|nr:NAD-dependent epimerase/dehydratase family protein [Streptomyces sp. HNM0575]NLU72611.1 NAD-dependent epimerase/dehydratase family protein [Streptomyces sp. HNM0575]
MGRVVLVTGVARPLAGRFVRRVQREPDVDRVIGVDVVEPVHHLGTGAEFVLADIRQPDITGVLARYGVDTVVHMDVNGTPPAVPGSGGRGSVKEVNVIGTMQLLGACQKAPAVRRLVVKSTTGVYGGTPRDPAVFDESTPAKSLPGGGFAKDAVEVEGYVRGFARRRPEVSVTVLRFAHVLGPSMDSPLASYFALPVLPTVLGYDPRLQFVHEDDAVEVLRLAAREPRPGTLSAGTFNIAGDGTLLLSQCARRLGRPTVPMLLPAVRWGRSLLQSTGLADFSPEQVRLLTHGRVVRTAQMREVLGFEPRFTTAGTLAAFARGRGPGLLPPETLARTVDKLAAMVGSPDEEGPQDEEVGRRG